ncbi:MAG: protoglobin family protein, partial [Planctomycetaceae bacterium]|nr:protoglobin family protein [Planctomycetaceae bacterium]
MKQIDEEKLESDLAYRFQYLAEFIGITESDLQAIHGAAGALAPLVPSLVDAVYDQLFRYDCTKRHFVPRQSGYEGQTPESLETLTLNHEMIQFRKQHLGRYLETLVTRPYDEKMVQYLDLVGKIHTPKAGSPALNVPLVQMNALMGFVSTALINTILGLNLDRATEVITLIAFNKLLWIQNDFITRHYAASP